MSKDIPLREKSKFAGYIRTGSCTGEPQQNALQCLKSKELTIFTDIVNDASDEERPEGIPLPATHWINQPLSEEDDKTLLEVAIGLHLYDYIKVLLQAGASANLMNPELEQAPIHHAANCKDSKAMSLLLEDDRNRADPNALLKGKRRSALHICAENGFEEGVDCLLRQVDIDINAKDKILKTPLYLAAKKGHEHITRKLIIHGAKLDIICAGEVVADVIQKQFPNLDIGSLPIVNGPSKKLEHDKEIEEVLIQMISAVDKGCVPSEEAQRRFKSVVKSVNTNALNQLRCRGVTLLQRACEKAIVPFVASLLLDGGVDPNTTTENAPVPPLLLAANGGLAEILSLFQEVRADFTIQDDYSKETVLHRLLKNGNARETGFVKSLETILNSKKVEIDIRKIINKRDLNKQTALHYATQMWPQHIVRRLLELGANIGMKNQYDEVPIANILPSTMEAFLDEYCLTSMGDVNHDDFKVTFNYSFLAPPKEDLPAETLLLESDDPESQKLADDNSEPKLALPETQSLWYMGQSKEHRHLLKHPVITSFLHLKWARIRRFFNRNVRFYLLFVFILTWYIFQQFGADVNVACSEEKIITNEAWRLLFVVFSVVILVFILRDWMMDIKDVMRAEELRTANPEGYIGILSSKRACCLVILSNWVEVALLLFLAFIIITGAAYLKLVLGITLLILITREFFQVTVSLKRYIFSPENWMEVGMIILVSIILLYNPEDCPMAYDIKRTLSSFAIILSWAELITLVGKHPKLTQYNIYVTMFYKVMGTFFFFLSWYAFFIVAFGLAFYIMLHKQPEDTGEDDYIFFNSPWLALVKTSTMFVGELEFSDIPINTDNSLLGVLGYTFFLSFVFLIVVVLMNLLNGLAVSDTGIIQEKAEIVSYISRVETISYTESVLLGDPFNYLSNWPALKWIINLPSCSICGQLYKNEVIKQIFHKITGATGILLFYNFLPERKLQLQPNDRRIDCCFLKTKLMDPSIIKATKAIVLKKQSDVKTGDIENRLKTLENKIDLILYKLDGK